MRYLLFLGFSIGIFTWLVAAERQDFKVYEIQILVGLLIAINLAQLALVAGLRRAWSGRSASPGAARVELLALSLLTAVNVYFCAASAIRTAFLLQVALAAGIGAAYFVLNLSPRNARFGARLTHKYTNRKTE